MRFSGLISVFLMLSFPISAVADSGDVAEMMIRASALNRLGYYEDASAAAREVLKSADSSDQKAVAAIILSRSLRKSESKPDVVPALDEEGVNPVLEAPLLYEKGMAMLDSADANLKGFDDGVRAFLRRFPKHYDAAKVHLAWGQSLLKRGRSVEAGLQASLAQVPNADRGTVAEARLLEANAESGDARAAGIRDLFIEMPDTVAAASTGLREEDLSEAELRRRAEAFFSAYDYVGWQRVLKLLWARGDRSPELAYRIARSHLVYVRDDPEEALRMLQLARRGGVANDPEGTFMLGRIYSRLEDYDSALKQFQKYIDSGARRRRMLAHYYMAWLPYDHGEYEKALPAMDRFLRKYRKSDRYSYMIWFKGWSLYRMGRLDEAVKVFSSMKRLGNSLVAGKAMYWGGMALHRLGRTGQSVTWMEEVIERYPLTWYSVLAVKRLSEWHDRPPPEWLIGPAAVEPDGQLLWRPGKLPSAISKVVESSMLLAAAGRPRDAWNEYRKVADRAEKGMKGKSRARFMTSMAHVTEQYSRLYRLSGRVFRNRTGRTPSRGTGVYWETRYPRAYRHLVEPAAAREEIPDLWVYAIMRQESRYDPGQISHTAALGVMQMISATAGIVGGQLGVDWEVDTFFEPGLNVLFGTRYLSDLYEDFKGQIVFASAAYNSGAPAIKRFMKANRGLPLDEMVEMIPYNEGRNYCRKVAEHLVRYSVIYLEPPHRQELLERIFPDAVDYDLGTSVNY